MFFRVGYYNGRAEDGREKSEGRNERREMRGEKSEEEMRNENA